jgi:hypothetical protein
LFRRRQQTCAHAAAVVTSVYRNDVYLGTPREMALDGEEANEFVSVVSRKRRQYFGIIGETEQGLFYAEPLRQGPQYGLAVSATDSATRSVDGCVFWPHILLTIVSDNLPSRRKISQFPLVP